MINLISVLIQKYATTIKLRVSKKASLVSSFSFLLFARISSLVIEDICMMLPMLS